MEKSGFWDKIAFDFQLTILSTISYFDTIIFDLNIIKTAFTENRITEKEVKLLRNIGVKAISYNHEYGRTFREDKRDWHDYGNPDFREVEEIYGRGRDYFVTMQDASNAAARLEDYMEKGQVTNNTLNIHGNVSASQIQQNTVNSTQKMDITNSFDYSKALDMLNRINRAIAQEYFDNDFGEKADEVRQIVIDTISMVEKKEEPSKIKNMLLTLRDLAVNHGIHLALQQRFYLLPLILLPQEMVTSQHEKQLLRNLIMFHFLSFPSFLLTKVLLLLSRVTQKHF